MGRSVSYPSGAVVAFTVLEVEDDDDWDFEYEWLREDLRERAGQAFPSQIASRFEALFGDYVCLGHMSNGEGVYAKRVA